MIYLLSKREDFSFAAQKLAKFSPNPGKVKFEGLVHLFRCIRNNKTLGLNYFADMKYSPLSEILRQANINTNNQLMDFYASSWQDGPDTVISTGEYIIFIKVDKLNMTHMFQEQLLN